MDPQDQQPLIQNLMGLDGMGLEDEDTKDEE